jgi:hypothetical protein
MNHLPMNITILPKGKDRKHHKIYKTAIQYFLNKLLAKRYQKRINSIVVKLVDSLDYGSSRGECREQITTDGKFDIIFKIVATDDLPQIISTLAHETVHLKQTVKFELVIFDINGEQYWIWKGKKRKFKKEWYDVFTSKDQYAKLPWEKEAYDSEMELARSFFWNHYSSNY